MTEDTSPENLRKFLESDDPAMVRMGLSMAKGMNVKVTLKDLEHFLKSEDTETIKAGIMLADEAGVGDEAMEMLCEPLTETLSDNDRYYDPGVREDAAYTLGEIGDVRAVEPLIEALYYPKGYVCDRAVVALGKIGDERAVFDLSELLGLEGEYMRYREFAAEALGRIGEPATESLIWYLGDANSNIRRYAARALVDIGKPAVESLITALEECDGYWGAIAEVLGEIGDGQAITRAVKSLIEWLEDEDVREDAKEALEKLGHEVE